MSLILSLPPELLAGVFEQCTQSDLLSLCQTCCYVCSLARPLLYQTIDISWHNDGLAQAYLAWKKRMNIQLRQLAFMKTLESKPDLALHVRRFTWTLHLRPMNCVPAAVRSEWRISRFYRMLQGLVNVKHLDLNGGPICYGQAPSFDERLFPRAQNIRLGGKLHYSLAAAILLAKNTNIRSLVLHNLQDPGARGEAQGTSDDDTYDPSMIPALPLCSCAKDEEVWEPGMMPRKTPTGPMRRLLRQLAQEKSCHDLECFWYGMDFGYYARHFVYHWVWEDLMHEILLFLRTFRPPTVTLEYGTDLPSKAPRPTPLNDVDHVHGLIPLDDLLSDAIGPQTRLKHLCVRGCLRPVKATTDWITQLREHSGIELTFDEILLPCWSSPLLSTPQEYFEPEPLIT